MFVEVAPEAASRPKQKQGRLKQEKAGAQRLGFERDGLRQELSEQHMSVEDENGVAYNRSRQPREPGKLP